MKALCPYYRQCSGCNRLQFPYVKQLRDKNKWLGELFAAVPGAAAALQPIRASAPEWGYRSSAKLVLHEDAVGRRSIGLYERGTRNVVAIPKCPVQHEGINRLVQKMFAPNRPTPAPFYQHQRKGFQEGCLKFVTVRLCPRTGEAGVIVSHTGVPEEALRAWAEGLRLPNVAFYASALTRADEANVLGREARHVAGPSRFRYAIGEDVHALHPMAFFQANHVLAADFVAEVTAAHAAGGDTLLDLYAGFGAYAARLLGGFAKAVLVDGNPDAMAAARENLTGRGTAALVTETAYVEAFLGKLAPAVARHVTDVIANPPRVGMHRDAVSALGAKRFPALKRMTYVSCAPEALKRDLLALAKTRPFRIARLTPFDMFPHTDHVEMVASLTFA